VSRGRSQGDAPEIDGAVHVGSRRPLRAGDIVTVRSNAPMPMISSAWQSKLFEKLN